MFWPYIIIAYLTLFTYGLCDNIRGPLFPEILKDFAVNDTQGAMVFALSSAAGFIGSLATRRLSRRFDRLAILRLASLLQVVALLGLGGSSHFILFLFFGALSGWSMGVMGILPNVLVPLGAPPRWRQQVFSGLHSMYGLASFMAPLIVAVVAWAGQAWRLSFAVCAVLPLGIFLYSFRITKRPEAEPASPVKASDKEVPAASDHRAQLFLALVMGFYVMAEILMSSRLALFMRRQWGYSLEQSSLYLTWFFVCLLAGRMFFVFVSFSRPLKEQLSLSLLLSMGCYFLGLYFHPLFFILAGLTMAPFFPLMVALIANEFPEDLDSAMSYTIAMNFLMLIVMHLGVGYLTDLFGIAQSLLVGPCVLFLSLLMLNSFERLFRKKGV